MQATQVCRGGADCTASHHSGCGLIPVLFSAITCALYLCPFGVQWSPSNVEVFVLSTEVSLFQECPLRRFPLYSNNLAGGGRGTL